MAKFRFASDGTETIRNRCFFEVEAETEEEARQLLAENASEYFTDSSDQSGETDWDAEKPEDFELL
jgi:hypothetical protein